MFKNREVTVQLNKKKETDEEQIEDLGFKDKAEVIFSHVDEVVVKICIGVCAFVALDTVRQVAIERTKNKNS